jgi:hypothetical protein
MRSGAPIRDLRPIQGSFGRKLEAAEPGGPRVDKASLGPRGAAHTTLRADWKDRLDGAIDRLSRAVPEPMHRAVDGADERVGIQVVHHVTEPREGSVFALRQFPMQALRLAGHVGDLVVRP